MQHPIETAVGEKHIGTSGVIFTPVLPTSIPRYDRFVSAGGGVLIDAVPACTRLASEEIGAEWVHYPNPEGDTYFRHAQRQIVTQSNVRVPSTARWLLLAHDYLIELGRSKNLQIVEFEVYMHIVSKSLAACEVEYYFVDNRYRHPFWLHVARVQDLGLAAFETLDHLKAALMPEYWTHREYFPAHQPHDQASEKELIAIFRHGCADDMTSFGSMFPYGAQECRDHLRTLEGFVASGEPSSYRTATFARLWGSITRVRHINGYSLPGPRLDRNQGLAEFKNGQRPNFILRVLDILFLTLSRPKFDRITELWNGRVVFQRHWHVYFEELRSEWLRLAVLGLALFIVGGIAIVVRGPTPLVAAATSLASLSVISALALYERHSRWRFNTASDISSWIRSVESSRSGLLPLAIKFTMPQTTAMYSAFLLLMALLMLAADSLRESDSINSAMLLAAAFAPAIIVYLVLGVDTWNGTGDTSDQLVDAREPRFEELEV
ncbi:hypothetical protein FRC04_006679 [Tulasnella sp. 424]|nr:hypothetical protein FRC04_006679 [Tulasnella sp. 424]